MAKWKNIRANYVGTSKQVYLNTSGTGLLSKNTVKAVADFYDFFAENGLGGFAAWRVQMQEAKEKAAKMINADPSEIAIVPNMAIGMNLLARLFDSNIGVTALEGDFPTVSSAWKTQGFEVETIKMTSSGAYKMKRIAKSKGKIVAASHVQWHTGYKTDIDNLVKTCHDNDKLLILDATQSLGTCRIDVKAQDVDMLFASSYKWITAGFGATIMYVKKSILEQHPQDINWIFGIEEEAYLTAQRFEIGHDRPHAYIRLSAALDDLNEIGIERIEKRVQKLSKYCYKQLKKHGIELAYDYPKTNRSQIIIIKAEAGYENELMEQGIQVSYRGVGIRVGIHFYNKKSDIDQLIKALKKRK